MKIGELSARTGIATRMLRYYEEQGLIEPERQQNGYRDYDEHLVDRVNTIRNLLDTGIPTRIIAAMLPCLDQPQDIVVANPEPELRELLVGEAEKMTERIAFLEKNRDALIRYITAMNRGDERQSAAD